jgi:hypothetical protein
MRTLPPAGSDLQPLRSGPDLLRRRCEDRRRTRKFAVNWVSNISPHTEELDHPAVELEQQRTAKPSVIANISRCCFFAMPAWVTTSAPSNFSASAIASADKRKACEHLGIVPANEADAPPQNSGRKRSGSTHGAKCKSPLPSDPCCRCDDGTSATLAHGHQMLRRSYR